MRAQQQVQGVIQEAEREIVANRDAVAERAQQWVSDNVRPLQNQFQVGNQRLADRDSHLLEREIRIARLQAQLDAIQRQNAYDFPVASPTPVPESPITVHTDKVPEILLHMIFWTGQQLQLIPHHVSRRVCLLGNPL